MRRILALMEAVGVCAVSLCLLWTLGYLLYVRGVTQTSLRQAAQPLHWQTAADNRANREFRRSARGWQPDYTKAR
jgi:hypothetical protein